MNIWRGATRANLLFFFFYLDESLTLYRKDAIELLLSEQYNHSVTRVYEVIDHVKHPYITKDIIAHIKCHDKSYCKLAKKFDLNSISFNIK